MLFRLKRSWCSTRYFYYFWRITVSVFIELMNLFLSQQELAQRIYLNPWWTLCSTHSQRVFGFLYWSPFSVRKDHSSPGRSVTSSTWRWRWWRCWRGRCRPRTSASCLGAVSTCWEARPCTRVCRTRPEKYHRQLDTIIIIIIIIIS